MCHSVEFYLPRLATRAAEERARDWLPDVAPARAPEPGLFARLLAWARRGTVGKGADAVPAE